MLYNASRSSNLEYESATTLGSYPRRYMRPVYRLWNRYFAALPEDPVPGPPSALLGSDSMFASDLRIDATKSPDSAWERIIQCHRALGTEIRHGGMYKLSAFNPKSPRVKFGGKGTLPLE